MDCDYMTAADRRRTAIGMWSAFAIAISSPFIVILGLWYFQ